MTPPRPERRSRLGTLGAGQLRAYPTDIDGTPALVVHDDVAEVVVCQRGDESALLAPLGLDRLATAAKTQARALRQPAPRSTPSTTTE